MTITLPANAGLDLASTSSSFISGISPFVLLILGAIFAFFILDSIILSLSDRK